MKQWTYPIGFKWDNGEPANNLTNNILLKYFDKYIDPNKWFIKYTGGEPGLYPEIAELIPESSNRGYRGFIENNGSMYIPKSDNFVRLAAWHYKKPMPKYYDIILIIENDKDNWQEKVKILKEKNIPFLTTPLRGGFGKIDGRVIDENYPETKIKSILHIYSAGQLFSCPEFNKDYGNIFNMDKPIPRKLDNFICKHCTQVHMIERLYGGKMDKCIYT